MTNTSIGILGGTFDPVHIGHLRIALQILELLKLTEIRFIPCQQPVHKPPAIASVEQRKTMLSLALAKQNGFTLDTREIERNTPSYTIDTLASLQGDYPNSRLNLIIGSDEFAIFNTWRDWQGILACSNLIIVLRPECPLPQTGQMAELLNQYQTQHLSLNKTQQIHIPNLSPLPISSSAIRQQLKKGFSPRYLLPDAVHFYLQEQQIYL